MKKRKFFTSLTLLFMMLFQMIPVNVNALDSNTLITGEYGNVEDYLIYVRHENATPDDPGAPMPDGGFGVGTKYKRDNSGNIYYCLEEHYKVPGTVTNGAPESLTSAEYNVITKGYSKSNPSPFGSGFTRGESYYITQLALWIVSSKTPQFTSVSEFSIYDNPTYGISQEKFDAIIGEINKLVNEARNNPDPHLLELGISGNTTANYSNGTFTAGPFRITSNMPNTLSSFSINMVDMPQGAVVLDASGNIIAGDNITIGQQFSVRFPASGNPTSGQFTINATGSLSYGAGITYAGPTISGIKYQDVATVKDIPANIMDRDRIKATITFDTPTGTLEVLKVDAQTKNPVPNTQFRVTGNGVNEVITTGTDGLAFLRDLLPGDYIVTEISVPAPYILNSTPMNVTIIGGQAVRVTQENDEAKGRITIHKHDSVTGETPQGNGTLEGAVFEIRNSSNEVVQTVTTNSSGIAVSDLLAIGTYTVKEITAPTGYQLNDSTFTVNITYTDQLTEVNEHDVIIENEVISGKIQIVKINSKDNETPVEGATFEVMDKDGNVVDTITSDANGFATTKDLPFGDYTIKEKTAPAAFWLNPKEYPMTISEDGKVYVQYITNKPIEAKIMVVKTDSETGAPLEGVEFQILDSEGNVVNLTFQEGSKVVTRDTFITDEDGTIITQAFLPYGQYTLTESKPLPGYVKGEDIPFSIDKDQTYIELEVIGTILQHNITNTKIYGSVELTKIDSDGTLLEGVAFGLYEANGTLVGEYTTNADGKIEIDKLVYGAYYMQEISAPEQYILTDEKLYFSITENGVHIEMEMENQFKEGTLDLTKTDISTGELLPNTKISIYKEDGTLVEEKITDENGKAVFENIRYGKYYFKETEAPEGYILNPENHPFEIKEDGEVIKAELKNQIFLGTLELTKTDISTGNLIPNTKISIHKEDGTLVEEKITDENGHVTFTEIRYGKYYFLESEAPEGYVLNTEKHPFEVKEDGQVIKDVLDNYKIVGSYGITKTDMSTGEVLPNTLISIYSKDGNLIESKRTDENGYVEFEDFVYGDYYFVESDAPEGYVLNTEKHPFSITENGTVVKDELKNTKIVGEVEITKKDIATDEVIPGAKIEIYDANGKKVYEGISDKDGKITTTLEYGKYTFKETVAPNGYVLNEAEGQFEIKENGQIVKAQLYNKKEILPKTGMMDSPIAPIGLLLAVIGGILMFVLAGKKRLNTSKIASLMLAALLVMGTFGGNSKVFATESNAFPVLEAENIEMRVGERWSIKLHNATATDIEDGNLTRKIHTKQGNLALSTADRATETGTFTVTLQVFDTNGNTTTKDVTVTVKDRVVAPENEIPVKPEVTTNPGTIVVVPQNIKVNNQNIAEDITLEELQAMQSEIKEEELKEIERVNAEAKKKAESTKTDSADKEDLPQTGTAKSMVLVIGAFVLVTGITLMFMSKKKSLKTNRN